MAKEIKKLEDMEYPGRFIIIGRLPLVHENFVLYAITGRSTSSQARVMEPDEKKDRIFVKPTDLQTLIEQGGNPELLIYESIIGNRRGYAVSNG